MSNTSFLQQLLTLPSIINPMISPDGKWIAYMWHRVHANIDVFVVSTDGSTSPLALTNTLEATFLVSWTADSSALLVAEDHDRDERARLFRVEIDRPGVMIPLTEDHPNFFLRGGNLSPDGQTLFYGVNYDFSVGQEQEATWIYRHDLASGQRTPIACPVKPTYVIPQLNLQGTQILYNRKERHPAGTQWWLVGVDGTNDHEILNFGDKARVIATWHPDGEHILFLSNSKGQDILDYTVAGVLHAPSGVLRWLVDDPKRSLEDIEASPDGLVIVDEVRLAGHAPTFIDLKSGNEHSFPAIQGNLVPLGRAADGTWVARYFSSTSPDELVRVNMETGALSSLTHTWERTSIRPDQLVPAEDFSWQSVDGQEIHGWLYRAKQENRTGAAILYIHGGPTAHSSDRVSAEIQYYLSRGFDMLDVNYRGSTGYGLKFREAIKEDGWGGREQADITSGAQALVRQGLAKPGKVAVTGTSYGGYSSWCQITGVTGGVDYSVIGAAAPICGMTDLVVDYQTTRPDLRPLSEEMIGGRPDQIPQKYYQRSPINFVQHIHGRLLIVQGALDPNVSPQNVRDVVARLEQHGIPFEVLVFDDEGHGVLKPVNQEKLYPAIADFFEKAFLPA